MEYKLHVRMNRRTFLTGFGATGALVLIASRDGGSLAADSRWTATRPNVVMIVADDMGWTDFGFMGHSVIQTPHLDRLASESAVFPNGYVPTSLCRASLATLLTGLYAHQHRICCNDPPEGIDRRAMHPFIRNAPTVPRLLKEVGYLSLQTGKFWEGHYANAGFTHGMTTNGRREGQAIGRQTMQPIYDFIGESRDQPFFIWYAPMMPHLPHDPPERTLKKYAVEGRDIYLAKYYAMCEWFDETCGELLDYLDKKGLRDNTLVVFVVDNGWIQPTSSQLRQWEISQNPQDYALALLETHGKRSPYDAGVRTPIMLRWPGHIKPGRYKDLVSTIDLAPTILGACGVKPPDQMPGLNLLDIAAGKSHLRRKAVFGEIYLHTCVDLNKPTLSLLYRWVREGDWKLIVPGSKTARDPFEKVPVAKRASPELYNLVRDPFEKKNLAATNPGKVSHLMKVLDAWWKA